MKRSPRKNRSKSVAPTASHSRAWWIAAGVLLAAGAFFTLHKNPAASKPKSTAAPRAIVEDEQRVFSTYAGSATCRECHTQIFDQWAGSHHGLAERAPSEALDGTAFEPPRTFTHGTQKTEVRRHDGKFEVQTTGPGGKVAWFTVDRVIGDDPLRQFLVAASGGRWQALEVAFDPKKSEWFDVYGAEDRQPGEWGHWTGRGMTWNSMCASCHNTRVRKNYDPTADTFHTAMAGRTVACESCHGPMKAHVAQPQAPVRRLTRDEMLDTCGSCHARRGEITGDFHPGEKFTDHHTLAVVDDSDTYFPDGQVRDEDYEFGSFLGSRMHAAGVRCADCHEPHTAKTLAPGNALCMRCHAGGPALPGITRPAPLIDPVAHSHHGAESAGARCTSCHMPTTVYMQRHARHDHGFTIPDPLLTTQLGIPNACNRCHTDKDAAWSLVAVEQWYGAKMARPSRDRAEAVAAARHGSDAGREPLLKILEDKSSPYWQAAAARLLLPWAGEPRVGSALVKETLNPNPLVRAATVPSLEPLFQSRPDAREMVSRLLDDSDRSVRVAAAWALRETLPLDSLAGAELQHQMNHNADQPLGRMQLAAFALARGNLRQAVDELRRAVEWDPNSAPIRHEFAVALSNSGDTAGAVEQLQNAVRLEPKQAEYHYKLALAWNESGHTDRAAAELQTAVTLDPMNARAWYNLGLARNALGNPAGALAALQRGEAVAPADPRLPYARATIQAQLGHTAEARAAAQRALDLDPRNREAQNLLRQLGE